MSSLQRVFAVEFSSIYPFYVQKAEKKGDTQVEVERVMCWLTVICGVRFEEVPDPPMKIRMLNTFVDELAKARL